MKISLWLKELGNYIFKKCEVGAINVSEYCNINFMLVSHDWPLGVLFMLLQQNVSNNVVFCLFGGAGIVKQPVLGMVA